MPLAAVAVAMLSNVEVVVIPPPLVAESVPTGTVFVNLAMEKMLQTKAQDPTHQ